MDINEFSINREVEDLNKYMGQMFIKDLNNEIKIDESKKFELGILISNLIKKSTIEESPKSLKSLKEMFNKFKENNEEIDFTLDYLIQEGWIRVVCDFWYVNSSSIYRIRDIDVEKLDKNYQQIILFIKQVSKENYSKGRIILNDFNSIIENHRIIFKKTPQIQWFEENEIIINQDNNYLLNTTSDKLRPYINQIIANYWSELLDEDIEEKERLIKWIKYKELFNCGYGFWNMLSNDDFNMFAKIALDLLLSEEDMGDWKKEISIMNKKLWLENPKYIGDKSIWWHEPEDTIEKIYKFYDKYDITSFIQDPRENIDFLLDAIISYSSYYDNEILVKLIDNIEENVYLNRFLLENKIHLFHKVIIPLLSNSKTFLLGTSMILEIEYLKKDDYIYGDLWNRIKNILIYYLNSQEISVAYKNIADLLRNIIEKGRLNHNCELNNQKIFYSEKYSDLLKLIYSKATKIINANDICISLSDIYNKEEIPISNPVVYFMIDFLENKDKFNLINLEKIYDYLYKIYIKSINNATRYLDLKILSDNISKSKVWVEVLASKKGKPKEFYKILKPIHMDMTFENEDKLIEYEGKLNIQYKVLYHLNFMSNIIANDYNNEKLDNEEINKIGVCIKEYIINYQDDEVDLDIFDVGIMQNLDSRPMILSIIKSIYHLSENIKNEILNSIYIQTSNTFNLIIIYEALLKIEDKNKLEEIIVHKLDKLSIDNVVFIPQMQNLIQCMTNIKSISILDKALYVIEKYENRLTPKQFNDNKEWSQSIKAKISYMKEDYETILSSDNKFYKGLVFLEKKQYNEAIEIFESILKEEPNNLSAKINLFSSYIRYQVSLHKEGKLSEEIMKNIDSLATILMDFVKNNEEDKNFNSIFYQNVLFLYASIEDYSKFWEFAKTMNEDLLYSKECGVYVLKMMSYENDTNKAKTFFEKLIKIYGENDLDLVKIKSEIKSLNLSEPSIMNRSEKIKSILYSLSSISRLNIYDKGKIYYNDENEINLEQMLLRMVLEACNKVNDFSPNLIWNENTSDEDTYNGLVREFFNSKFEETYKIRMEDQHKGGYTGNKTNKGKEGIGEIDLRIMDNDCEVSIAEGIKLDSRDTSNIFKHINKIFGYDRSNHSVNFIIVYGNSKKPKQLWDKYKEYLNADFIKDCKSNEIRYEVIENDICSNLDYIAKDGYLKKYFDTYNVLYTKHINKNNNAKCTVFHIFIDVYKFENRDIAYKSRNKK